MDLASLEILESLRDVGYNKTGGLHNIDISTGYHNCVGHCGTTTTPVAFSCFIFCKTVKMQLKGGKQ